MSQERHVQSDSATKTVRDIRRATRRRFSAEDNILIVAALGALRMSPLGYKQTLRPPPRHVRSTPNRRQPAADPTLVYEYTT